MATEPPTAADPAAAPRPGGDKAPVDESHGAPQPKRFSALNINQRFLQSAKEAAPKAQAPAAAPTPAADEARAAHNPRLVTAMPGRGAASASTAAADPARKEAPRDTPTAHAAPWAHVKPAAPRVNISSHDFPTAKEVMEAEKKAEERAAAHAAEEHARQQAANEELERFRGAQLPSSEHWDDMEEESEDELDDVVEFGDGKQYKISEVEEELAKSHPPRPEPRVPAWGPASRAPWRGEPARESAPPVSLARAPPALASQPAPAPAPAATWGPLAQRHSTLTGKPVPKIEPSAPVVPTKERAAEVAAEQHDEMATAAERARKRREQDEQAREAERARARQKAAQIEEQLREAERAKREARERELEAQRERLRERLRAQQEAREEHARQRLEREKREREQREKREREQREQRRLAKEEARRAKEEPASWRRSSLPASSPGTSTARTATQAPATVLIPVEPPVTCEPLPAEEAPVWRQYTVRMPRAPHDLRRPSEAAVRAQRPRDPPGLLQSCEPPLDYARVDARATVVDILFPPRRARVHLPQRRIEPAAPQPHAPLRPMDEARWLEQLLGHVEQHPSSALFADEAPSHAGARPRRKRAPRVKLPRALSWRRPSLKALRLPYGGLLDDPFTSPAPEVPLLDTQSQSTWGATLALPLVSTAQPDPAEHSRLKSMWANSSKDTESRPKNSLRDIATDDVLPTPLPLSMHELREAPPSKLDVLAMPFRPSQSAESAPWSYPRDRAAPASAAYYIPMGGYAPRRTGAEADAYVNPSDYSDFVLSDSW
ncbi:Uncharacterized protein MSYG_1942 [Malassezia sympodialis ATCC 42132]|uniref:Uncharacterized protein n=1 Tax=Malassezia sympodialis (strain ATCC 42132) TaxID=1230383 RepID=A0A1M8A545_MALS4|nr:Uncharacterized protein MSYG_1942 [Malassezia sympodialis ATCC 42132]